MKKCGKIILGIIVLLLGLISLFICEEHFRGQFALNSRLNQLQAKGEKLDYKELIPLKIPPEQNAALALSSVTNELEICFKLMKGSPLTMTFTKAGKASAAWQHDSWEVDKKTSNSWSKFGPSIAAANPYLTKLETIWTNSGFDNGYDYATGFTDTNFNRHLIICKQTCLLLCKITENDLRNNDLESARKHLHSALALIRCFGTQPLIINQLVDTVCAQNVWNETWSALQAKGWTDSQLADLQSSWETVNDFPSAMARSCELERAMTVDYFRQLHGSRSKAFDQVQCLDLARYLMPDSYSGPPTQGFVLKYVHLPLWQIAWASQDELRAVDRWAPLVEAGKVGKDKSWADIKGRFPADELEPSFLGFGISPSEQLGLYDRCRYLFSSDPFSVNGSTLLRPLEVETEKNMAVIAIALKRFQLRHDKLPAQLTDLVPEYFNSVPLDRMDGKPIRYHLIEAGSFRLYSVGINGTDDGGDPEPEKPSEKFGKIWEGKDAVWPFSASHN